MGLGIHIYLLLLCLSKPDAEEYVPENHHALLAPALGYSRDLGPGKMATAMVSATPDMGTATPGWTQLED